MAIDLQAAIAVFDKSANAQTEAWAVIRAELMRVPMAQGDVEALLLELDTPLEHHYQANSSAVMVRSWKIPEIRARAAACIRQQQATFADHARIVAELEAQLLERDRVHSGQVERHLSAKSDLRASLTQAESELAALRARVMDAPVAMVEASDDYYAVLPTDGDSYIAIGKLSGKRVRLVPADGGSASG